MRCLKVKEGFRGVPLAAGWFVLSTAGWFFIARKAHERRSLRMAGAALGLMMSGVCGPFVIILSLSFKRNAKPKIRDTIFVQASSSGWKGIFSPFCVSQRAPPVRSALRRRFRSHPEAFRGVLAAAPPRPPQVGASQGKKAALVIITFLA